MLSKSNKSHELNIWTLLLFYSITKIIINNMSRFQMWNMFLLNQIVQCRNQTLEMAASHCKLMIYQLHGVCQMSHGIFQMIYFRGYINWIEYVRSCWVISFSHLWVLLTFHPLCNWPKYLMKDNQVLLQHAKRDGIHWKQVSKIYHWRV